MINKKNQSMSLFSQVMNYFISHLLAFKLSIRNLRMTPLASILTITAIGMCLSFPAGLIWFIKNVQQMSQGWAQGSSFSIYINNKSTPQQIHVIQTKINAFPFVKKSIYITPQTALLEFQEYSGLKDALALLPDNPLPGVISIEIDPQKASKQQINEMQKSLRDLPQVTQARFDTEWINKLNAILSFGKTFAFFLYSIIGLGVVLMMSNTICLALEGHKDELEALNLIGATTAFIRRPFLYRGTLYGALGGIIAVLIINLMTYILKAKAEVLGNLFDDLIFLEHLTFYDTLLLFGISALLGWIGAQLAFAQQNRHPFHENT